MKYILSQGNKHSVVILVVILAILALSYKFMLETFELTMREVWLFQHVLAGKLRVVQYVLIVELRIFQYFVGNT